MFDMNPLNLPDAQLQHLVMLFVAGMLGFIIGYVSRQSLIRQLEGELTETERAVEDCRRPTQSAIMHTEETIVLNRIRSRASAFSLDHIGIATPDEADDLKQIVGVGPFLEKKLNVIGIYTFRQIANFTTEDVEQVNDLIEFFPGRIQRDNWVGQAREFLKRS